MAYTVVKVSIAGTSVFRRRKGPNAMRLNRLHSRPYVLICRKRYIVRRPDIKPRYDYKYLLYLNSSYSPVWVSIYFSVETFESWSLISFWMEIFFIAHKGNPFPDLPRRAAGNM